MKRECPICAAVLLGRTDKKYCSSYCRSIDHYQKRKNSSNQFYLIDKQLKKNRCLLKSYYKSGNTTLRKSVLMADGFHPEYFTHRKKDHQGQVFLFCYEYGLLAIKENNTDKYLIVHGKMYEEKEF